jgi:uncharacterized membrane protein/uncharacterized protein YegL
LSLEHPHLLWLAIPALLWVAWAGRGSQHPMGPARRRAAWALRSALVVLAVLALAGPGAERESPAQAVVFVVDHSRSMARAGLERAVAESNRLLASLPGAVDAGFVGAGAEGVVHRLPGRGREPHLADPGLLERDGHQSDLAQALSLASGLFPAGAARRVVLLTDGLETRGDLVGAARDAAARGIRVDTVTVRGEALPDARVLRLRPSRTRAHEGAAVALTAEVESTIAGRATLRLFENGVEVDARPVDLAPGPAQRVEFQRTPAERNLYRYRVRVEGLEGDRLPENDEAMTLVDVRGRPLLLLVHEDPEAVRPLVESMAREGIRLHERPPGAIPGTLEELAVYDGVVLADVPAYEVGAAAMARIHDYVEQLGGGFLMIGGARSFGVGGYYRTPIEDVLPVRMQPPDRDERYSTALALVLDKSGSMQGTKIEICKSAAVATAEMLSEKDFLGVVAFDANAHWILPMTRVGLKAEVEAGISTLQAGGGTNALPAMSQAFDALRETKARVKHMIVLTDGHTQGGGYEALAGDVRAAGISVSTVGIGDEADNALLERIAAAGGGKHYATNDLATVPRIFTQDAATHLGRLVREEAFQPQQVEEHPMLAGWPASEAPPLLGYVKTLRKATTQVPLVTDLGDPLLAHWRFGLGKVTAFTSDCGTRWSALWLSQWSAGYAQFWGQVLREMARPPQGRAMDLRVEMAGHEARLQVDVLADPAHFDNAAEVEADVYFVPRGALGSTLRLRERLRLEQSGPGRYAGAFRPGEPGVYLVRARSGAEMVSAGLVHERSGESATARVDEDLLQRVRTLTGGEALDAPDATVPPHARPLREHRDLVPALLAAILLLFLVDLGVRRAENALGLWDLLTGWTTRARR